MMLSLKQKMYFPVALLRSVGLPSAALLLPAEALWKMWTPLVLSFPCPYLPSLLASRDRIPINEMTVCPLPSTANGIPITPVPQIPWGLAEQREGPHLHLPSHSYLKPWVFWLSGACLSL